MAVIDFAPNGILVTGDYSKLPRPIITRTDMESGPPKQRPYASSTMFEHQVTYVFAAADYTYFLNTWYTTTASFGSVFFNWTDPTDGTVKDTRIVNGQISSCVPTSGLLNYMTVKMTFETYT